MLSTRKKILLAGILSRLVRLIHRVLGRSMPGIFTRGGLRWELDLREGIDFAIWLFGRFEPGLVRYYIRHIPLGACVMDIGANIGAHTLPLARQVGANGRVVAVEATAFAFGKLQANLALNLKIAGQVVPVHALLVSSQEMPPPTHIHSSWPLGGAEEVHPLLGGVLKPLGEARIVTADQLAVELRVPRVDWIKLDVDGNELAVLLGAESLVRRDRPRILMELAPYCHTDEPGRFEKLIRWLQDMGYTLHDTVTGRELPRDLPSLHRRIPRNGSINILAAHSPAP